LYESEEFKERKMIGKLNHVAIAVPDAVAAGRIYRDTLGAKITEKVPQPDHGVYTVFVELPNTKIELIEPLGDNSPIAGFLSKNPKGGIHHVCYEVEDIHAACAQMKKMGATITGTGEPRIGAHGKPVVFLHPKDFSGTLIELEQV
jgi:methylmalonyl-CoA/ethylmalonyl-CoA epimerase